MLWVLITFGAWIYLIIGYKWGKLALEATTEKNSIKQFFCFPGQSIMNKINSDEGLEKSFTAAITWNDREYLAAMTFFWPLNLALLPISFFVGLVFGSVYKLFDAIKDKRSKLASIIRFIKKYVLLSGEEEEGIKSWWARWRERRRVKRAAKEQKLLAAHEVDPIQEELRRYEELRRLIPEREHELVALKSELDGIEARRSGTYREPAVVAERDGELHEGNQLPIGGSKFY